MTVDKKSTDLDDVLERLGGFGRFQILNVLLLSVLIVFSAVYGVTFIFTAGDLNYRCFVPGCDANGSATFEQPWLSNALPMSDGKVNSSCQMFRVITDNVTCRAEDFSKELMSCQRWVYENDETTILREDWGLECDNNRWKLSLVGTVNNLGQVAGMSFVGFISDRYGRRTMLVAATVSEALMGLIRSFSSSYPMFVTFEFLDQVVGTGLFSGTFVLALELVSPGHRVLVGSLISGAYALGEAILGLLAWYLQDWRTLLRVCYAPALLVLAYLWVVPESVRWLQAQGRSQEARVVVEEVARMNRVKLVSGDLELFDDDQQLKRKRSEDVASSSFQMFAIFKSRTMLLRFLNCALCWISNTFTFFGMSMVSVVISDNKYLSFILSGLIELPGYLLTYLIMDKFGRRPCQMWSLILSGLGCAAVAIVPQDSSYNWLRLSLFLFGKLFITVSFTVLYVYTTEMFPTTVRHSALSTCSMLAKVLTTAAPQLVLLSDYIKVKSLPVIIFGVLCLVSGALCSAFPETLNTHLPDTIEEAKLISKKKQQRNVEDDN